MTSWWGSPWRCAELTSGPVPQLEGQKKSQRLQQAEQLALKKPDDVANLLRGWMLERGGR